MQPEITEALARERRAKLVNLTDPEIIELWTHIRESLSSIIKSSLDLDLATEAQVIHTLLYASMDKLSGLSNKERFRVEVEAAMAVAKKLNIPLTLFEMDGRHFKEINDKLGHPVGDEVIKGVGEGLKVSTRSTDIIVGQVKDETSAADEEPNIEVARDGGDEFGAALLGADLEKAKIVAERIHHKVPETVNTRVPQLQQVLGHPFELTIGIAQYDPTIHKNAHDLIKAADDNLTQIRQQMGQTRRS